MSTQDRAREFETWFRKEGGVFFKVAYGLTRPDRQMAEDIASESVAKFFGAWMEGKSCELDSPIVQSTCARIVKNAFIDHYRKSRTQKVPKIKDGMEVEKAELLAFRKRYNPENIDLKLAVQSLPLDERAIISLVYNEGYTLSESGEKLGLTRSQASRVRKRALERLEIILREGEA